MLQSPSYLESLDNEQVLLFREYCDKCVQLIEELSGYKPPHIAILQWHSLEL